MDIWILAIFLGVLFLYFYENFRAQYEFWKQKGVPLIKPRFIFGNTLDVVLLRTPLSMFHDKLYKELAPHKFGLIFLFSKPGFLIRDLELVKNIMTKHFDHFHDRQMGFDFDPSSEPLGEMLFILKGERWRNLRIKLTSAFTTGKMKQMLPLIDKCAELLVSNTKQYSDQSVDTDIKDLVSRYGTDVIGSCAFGIDIDSSQNDDCEFRKMGQKFFSFRWATLIRLLFPNIPQPLIKLFKMQFVEPDVSDFFVSLVEKTVEYRERNNVTRNDFLDILIRLKHETDLELAKRNDEKKAGALEMTTSLMAAQCFLFFTGGFESTATVASFLLFELAYNQDVQKELQKEIDTVMAEHEELSYEAYKKMKYLDMVLEETLRKYPPSTTAIRECTKDYQIPGTDIVIPAGMNVLIPIYSIQHDEQYFENPEKFNPYNFSPDVVSTRHPYAYIPFGQGPRNCIAKRFAEMQVKVAVIRLIQKYEFSVSPKMKVPFEYKNNLGFLAVKDGIQLRCRPR